ncbi:MAG: hypothetical protein EPO40_28055 [Myxococcaceae bacterium]|nr:MAG: hypothetical protein EPO40_28055 [Myxococcaceae bacterium]
MKDLPHPWNHYLRDQNELAASRGGSRRGQLLEDRLTLRLETLDQFPTEAELTRAAKSEGRKERARAQLRRAHRDHLASVKTNIRSIEGAYEARERLRVMRAQVSEGEWALLHAVAEGDEYSTLARAGGVSEGSLRVRVLRLRQALQSPLSEPTGCRPRIRRTLVPIAA